MRPQQREAILTEQERHWPRCVQAGKEGNPFATLCYHCFGRHRPPRDEICPGEPPKPSAAELYPQSFA